MGPQDIPFQRNAYNAQEEAFNLGIRIEFVRTVELAWYWSPRDNAMMISVDLPRYLVNEAIAHCICHVELASTDKGTAAINGLGWRGRLEMDVHTIVAERLISLSALHDAISIASEVSDVAACLGVSEFMLSWRLQNLTELEIGELPIFALNRLQWGPGHDPDAPSQCGWPVSGTGDVFSETNIGKHRR
ncbi:hypothetical protein ACFWUP_09230 [Nocardia sp. NPDC058658]|uniref:hypothetical protein n=1 Tax=Nocardia sp. NPDC058658 TaxID=3346580 RepID=UPI00364F4A80